MTASLACCVGSEVTRATYPLDVEPLRLGLGKAEAGSVDKEAWDAQQLHGRPNQAGGDHVVDEESAIVREENAPVPGTWKVRGCSGRQLGELLGAGTGCSPSLGRFGSSLVLTGT